MTDYKKAWEDSVTYSHKLELKVQELEKTETHFAAELKAAENDYKRYKLLEVERDKLQISVKQLGNTIDSQQVWVDKYKAERDGVTRAYADECATNVYLKSALDVAMNENQRLTKIVEDYEAKEK